MKSAKTCYIADTPACWSDMLWGDDFRDGLTQHLQPFLDKLFGFHLIKVGNLSAEIDTAACAISHQVNVGKTGDDLQVIANPMWLPFESKSVDACLLAHTLAWSSDPHRILREVDRVLINDGWMMISGFNPYSLLGIRKILPALPRQAPWSGRMFSQVRLLDWLSLLNYEVIYRTCFQVIPWKRKEGQWLSKHLHTLGCMHIVVARKRTVPLTIDPVKKLLSKRRLAQTVSAARLLTDDLGQDVG